MGIILSCAIQLKGFARLALKRLVDSRLYILEGCGGEAVNGTSGFDERLSWFDTQSILLVMAEEYIATPSADAQTKCEIEGWWAIDRLSTTTPLQYLWSSIDPPFQGKSRSAFQFFFDVLCRETMTRAFNSALTSIKKAQ